MVEEEAKHRGMTVTKIPLSLFPRGNTSVSSSFHQLPYEYRQNFTTSVTEMVQIDSDVIVHCLAFPRTKNFVLELMRDEHDYTPRMFAGRGSGLDNIDAPLLPFQVILTEVCWMRFL